MVCVMRRTPLFFVAALVVVLGVVAAVVAVKRTSTSSTTTTTTTTVPIPIAPLSGMPNPGGAALTRPALTVKIENTPDARPLWGVNHADVVYEEIVNGGITRLAAIFNSVAPVRVGPVRSVRPTDVGVVTPIGGVFAYSGGAQYAINAIKKAPVTLVDETTGGAGMFRDDSRVAPNNLYLIAPRIFQFHGTPVPPPPLFTYRSATASLSGPAVKQFTVHLPSIYPVTFAWNATTSSWDRSIFGAPDISGTGVRLSPQNVIVMWINYAGGVGTMSSVGQLLGNGKADVFQGGKEIVGKWSRSALNQPTVYKDLEGKVISMVPGQTWVVLPAIGEALTVAH